MEWYLTLAFVIAIGTLNSVTGQTTAGPSTTPPPPVDDGRTNLVPLWIVLGIVAAIVVIAASIILIGLILRCVEMKNRGDEGVSLSRAWGSFRGTVRQSFRRGRRSLRNSFRRTKQRNAEPLGKPAHMSALTNPAFTGEKVRKPPPPSLCVMYQKSQCPFNEDHEGYKSGMKTILYHYCQKCWMSKKSSERHSEDSLECPYNDGNGGGQEAPPVFRPTRRPVPAEENPTVQDRASVAPPAHTQHGIHSAGVHRSPAHGAQAKFDYPQVAGHQPRNERPPPDNRSRLQSADAPPVYNDLDNAGSRYTKERTRSAGQYATNYDDYRSPNVDPREGYRNQHEQQDQRGGYNAEISRATHPRDSHYDSRYNGPRETGRYEERGHPYERPVESHDYDNRYQPLNVYEPVKDRYDNRPRPNEYGNARGQYNDAYEEEDNQYNQQRYDRSPGYEGQVASHNQTYDRSLRLPSYGSSSQGYNANQSQDPYREEYTVKQEMSESYI